MKFVLVSSSLAFFTTLTAPTQFATGPGLDVIAVSRRDGFIA